MDIPLQLDSIDSLILKRLQAQAKVTNAELAQHIGLSPASTLERVRKLESRGVITSYHAKLSPQKLGLHTHIMVQVKLGAMTTANATAFQEAIGHIPEVVACYQVVGEADFVLTVVTRDMVAYQHLVMEQLSAIESIQHLKPLVITATLKEVGTPILPPSTATTP